jgi:hypothetical protein
MAQHYEFDDKAVSNALTAAQAHQEEMSGLQASGGQAGILAGGEFMVAAQCISVKVQNHKVCLKLPLGIGSICLPLPINIPNGTAAEACLDICTTWGFPTGVRVTISVLGKVIVRKTFGKC